ncbi:MAG: PD-(D/E)XK nuclease family protein, partial [Vicinamibacterales bacterium]
RDALYLAGEVDDNGVLRAAKRSLASLLPISLRQAFTRAFVTEEAEVYWESEGHQFAARVCRPPSPAAAPPVIASPQPPVTAAIPVDREPLRSDALFIRSATSVAPEFGPPTLGFPPVSTPEGATERDRALDRVGGTLVHRLFQLRWEGPLTIDELVGHLGRLTRTEELVDVPDRVQLFEAVADAFLQLAWRPDVRSWLAAGQSYFEVPFSFVTPGDSGVLVRGSIDCLVAHPDGSVQVLEFKTGARRPEHSHQLDLYLDAARHAFPGAIVTGELVYPERRD